MNITINLVRNNQPTIQNNPQFTAGKANKVMNMKSIPGAPCACCGREMILQGAVAKACATITKPFKDILQKGFLDNWRQYPKIWKFLNRLADRNPDKSLDQILINDEDACSALKKAVSNNIDWGYSRMSSVNTAYNDIRYRSRGELKGAKAVMNKLIAFKPFLDGPLLEAFEQLQIYAQKYPRKRLIDIVHMKEVYSFHKTKDKLQKQQIEAKRNFHFNNMMNIIKKSKPADISEFEELRKVSEEIFLQVKDPKRRIFLIKEYYSEALDKQGCSKVKDKVLAEIDQMPADSFTADSFFVDVSKCYDDYSVIYRILSRYVETFEHINLNSRGGDYHIFNGVFLHSKCNYERDNAHYCEHFIYHPEMPYNLQKQIDFFAKIILDKGYLGDIRRWPIETAHTLASYTDGQLVLDVKDFYEKSVKKFERRMKRRDNELDDVQRSRVEQQAKIQKLKEELALAQKEDSELSMRQQKLSNDNNSESVSNKALKDSYKKYLG